MKLTRFEISGHARLQPMSVEVREHLVIVGANDVGKTSILRLLNYVLGASVQQLYQGLSVSDVDPDAEALVVKVRFEDFVVDEGGRFPFEMTIESGEPDYLSLTMEVRVSTDDPENVTIERYFPDSGTRRSPSREQLAIIGWRYMPANRADSTDYMDGKNSPFRAMLNSAEIGDEIADLGGLLDQFNDKLESNPALTELRRDIASHLSRSIPKTYNEDSLAIRTAADPSEQPLQDVTLFLKDGDGLKGLTEQSDGMRQLMALTFFDLAQATANIVAVDEPEMHLHASSQRTVASVFAESPKQRLLVTHSPYVVQRFEPKHVLVVSPQSVATQIDAVNFNAVEKEMLQWWSPQLLEGLTARRMLFVEGLADRIVVEAAAQVAGASLDRLGVSVFALDGADKFSHVLKIVGKDGFGLSICGLCDEDREAVWSGNLGIKPKKLADNGFFIARKDLEHEYARAIGGPELAKQLIAGGVARERGILQASGAASLDDVSDDMVADFITNKDDRKVPASRVVASILTADHIDQSPSLSGLIQFILQGE
jgi:putative ATP-dependent endonuclease of OLD family